ncbi:site-2 protease family protein [Candidatus Micrarchaeota archaeon]|nr:site-2 protease family protein [Candidatus Micrarchaeota archaeon]
MEGLYFDKQEIEHIIISVIAISLGFAIVFAGINGLLSSPKEFLVFMVLSLVTVGSGFILHEMAHKLVAIYYGASARFIMWTKGLLLMLITSVFGVLFAAPGAVYIYSNKITKAENGIISIVGPLTNLLLVGFFIALSKVFPVVFHLSFIGEPLNVWAFGAKINLILALFNMIPAFPLDGSKVFAWNKMVWIGTILILLGLGAVLISPFIIVSWGMLLVIALIFSKLAFGGNQR